MRARKSSASLRYLACSLSGGGKERSSACGSGTIFSQLGFISGADKHLRGILDNMHHAQLAGNVRYRTVCKSGTMKLEIVPPIIIRAQLLFSSSHFGINAF